MGNDMTTVIGIRGGKGSGKDTAARYLVEKYGAVQYVLAEDVKKIAQAVYRLPDRMFWGTQEEKEAIGPGTGFGISGRLAMQRVGKALRSTFGDNVFVERVFKKIDRDRPKLAVVSDVRHLNEADEIHLWGRQYANHPSYLWRLHYAPGLRKWDDPDKSEQEWMLGKVDLEITPGSGGLTELYALLDQACKMFGIEPLPVTKKPGGTVPKHLCDHEWSRHSILLDRCLSCNVFRSAC